MYRHWSHLSDADIAEVDFIHAVCTADIPIEDPDKQIMDVYWSGRIEDTRKLPGRPYARAKRLTVELPAREDLPKLQERISAVVGWDVTAIEDDDF
ncbi:MAG: hypothetical protein AB7O59_21120 [Pirellulales bacterium]